MVRDHFRCSKSIDYQRFLEQSRHSKPLKQQQILTDGFRFLNIWTNCWTEESVFVSVWVCLACLSPLIDKKIRTSLILKREKETYRKFIQWIVAVTDGHLRVRIIHEHHDERIVRFDCFVQIDASSQLIQRVVLVASETDELENGEHFGWCQGDGQMKRARPGQQTRIEFVSRHVTRPFRAIRVDVLAIPVGEKTKKNV